MGKNIGKKINKNLSMIRETAEATKVAYRITKISKNSQQKSSEIATNEYNKKIPKEIYIYRYYLE